MSRACATSSHFDFSSDNSSSLEEDEKVKRKQDDFTDLRIMGKSSRNISDSDSDVSDDLSFESLSLKVAKVENAFCNQDKLRCQVFRENKNLNLKMENSFSASLRSVHDDMGAKSCDNCKMINVNYADLWLMHTQVASQLKGAKLELRELKAHSLLLGACTSYPMLKSDLEDWLLSLKILSAKLIILLATVFYPLCAKCVVLSSVSFSMLPKRTPS
jgi:hypothetical protein